MIMCTLLSMVSRLFKLCWLIDVSCTCFKETTPLFNVHWTCFVDFILIPTDKYMFKVNKTNIWLICWMCSNLKVNTTWHHSGVFIVDFDQSEDQYSVSILNFKQAFVSSVSKTSHNVLMKTKRKIFVSSHKSFKVDFFQRFIIAPNWNKLWTFGNTSAINLL